jgi:hypothetical protein
MQPLIVWVVEVTRNSSPSGEYLLL